LFVAELTEVRGKVVHIIEYCCEWMRCSCAPDSDDKDKDKDTQIRRDEAKTDNDDDATDNICFLPVDIGNCKSYQVRTFYRILRTL